MINIFNAKRVYSTIRAFIMITNPDHSYISLLVKTNLNVCKNRTLTNSQKLETYLLTAVLSGAVCKLGEFSSEMDMHLGYV